MKATNIAFTGIPVTDIKRARAFYEGALGLKPAGEFAEGAWIEYEIGNGTFGIGNYGDQWKTSDQGTMVAFECDDLDAMVERVKQSGATVKMDIMDTPVCRFTIVADPDGNSVMLHKRRSG